MTNNRSEQAFPLPPAWRRWISTAILLCAVTGAPPLHAQDPAANQAVLNFVGADIESVIKAIGHYTNTTFIIDPRVKGTITLVSEKPVSKEEAFRLLTSVLRLQGYAVVAAEGFTKVVPEADAKLQAAPIQIKPVVRGDQIATQVFRLNYESAANLVPILRPLISPNNTINANPSNNTLVITDYADNLRRLGRIIAAMDGPAASELEVVPVRYAIASDLAVLANRLLEPGAAGTSGGDTGRILLLADTRTNSIIVRAPSTARANLAKSLLAKLDQPTAQPGNVHVVYLRNAEAIRLAQTLRAVVASETPSATQQQPGGMQPAAPPQQPTTATGQTQLGAGMGAAGTQAAPTPAALPTGGPGGFIQADAATNTLIITASEAVYRNLRTVIDQLDARRAQVYVESVIAEVTTDKSAQFGIEWLGLSGNSTSDYRVGGGTAFASGGDNILSQAVNRRANQPPLQPGNGLTIGLFRQINGQLGLGALVRALQSDANANILSVPNLITLDNEEARIIVGQNVPFITGQFTTAASGGAAGVNPFQTIERQDVGLALRVRPQISEGGTIKLQIYQETSSIASTTNAAGIITNKRSIESNVLVDDGEIVVLGGLIQDSVSDNVEKVPLLGDLPVVGNLFKYQRRGRTKTNLMVFLRPTVIRNSEQNASVLTDRYDYIRGVEAGVQPAPMRMLPDIDGPLVPPLQDGRPVGGVMLNVPPRKSDTPNTVPDGAGRMQTDPPAAPPEAIPPPTFPTEELFRN